uniref:Terpene synthase n=1 Tax=Ganoderma boninense TaxID=34458 RepID=A0A5K1K6Z2_9APHY|nr:Uncharacterized protein [Ganoderma boninense]
MFGWPWPAKFNPLHDEVEAESIAWLASLNPYTPASQRAHNKAHLGRLAAFAYPEAPRERLRTGTDFIHAVFVLDEYTDMESGTGTREICAIILDALRNTDKPRPAGEVIIGEIFRDLWARGRTIATAQAEKHFIEGMEAFLAGIVYQAEDRDNLSLRTVDSYMEARRLDSGVVVSFSPCELHLSIPDEAFYHPVMKEIRDASTDMIMLDNDVASYNREQAVGNANWNILSVVMRQYNLDLHHATEWVAQCHKVAKGRFFNALAQLPSFGPDVDAAVQEYIASIVAWPIGNDCWRFESERYFGTMGREVKKTRQVPLLAKKTMDPEMVREKVEVQVIDKLAQVSSNAVLVAA